MPAKKSKEAPACPFTVGAQVEWRYRDGGYSRTAHRGTVIAISAKGTLTVQPAQAHLKKMMFRPSKYGARYSCDLVSESKLALERWRAAEPPLEECYVGWGYYGNAGEPSLRLPQVMSLSFKSLDTISFEIAALRDWLAQRPGSPDSAPAESVRPDPDTLENVTE